MYEFSLCISQLAFYLVFYFLPSLPFLIESPASFLFLHLPVPAPSCSCSFLILLLPVPTPSWSCSFLFLLLSVPAPSCLLFLRLLSFCPMFLFAHGFFFHFFTYSPSPFFPQITILLVPHSFLSIVSSNSLFLLVPIPSCPYSFLPPAPSQRSFLYVLSLCLLSIFIFVGFSILISATFCLLSFFTFVMSYIVERKKLFWKIQLQSSILARENGWSAGVRENQRVLNDL